MKYKSFHAVRDNWGESLAKLHFNLLECRAFIWGKAPEIVVCPDSSRHGYSYQNLELDLNIHPKTTISAW